LVNNGIKIKSKFFIDERKNKLIDIDQIKLQFSDNIEYYY